MEEDTQRAGRAIGARHFGCLIVVVEEEVRGFLLVGAIELFSLPWWPST